MKEYHYRIIKATNNRTGNENFFNNKQYAIEWLEQRYNIDEWSFERVPLWTNSLIITKENNINSKRLKEQFKKETGWDWQTHTYKYSQWLEKRVYKKN